MKLSLGLTLTRRAIGGLVSSAILYFSNDALTDIYYTADGPANRYFPSDTIPNVGNPYFTNDATTDTYYSNDDLTDQYFTLEN